VRRFLLLVVLLVAGCGGDNGDGDGGSPAAAGGDTDEIRALDIQFDPARITVDAGATTFTLTNDGQTPHALTIEQDGSEEGTKTISPGESTSVTVELESGEYTLYCPVGNHRELGMEGTLAVGG
jgi:plastocyanin